MRPRILLTGLLVSVLASACGLLSFKRADAPVESGALSSDARQALTRRWPKWQLAVLDPQVATCASGQTDLPLLVELDADGDSASDVGVAIQTGEATRLVVILNRGWDTVVYDVDSLGGAAANGFLGVVTRGRRFMNPATNMDDYFSNPTVMATRCGEPALAYRWTGVGFEKVVLDAK